jgi:hypothetical protein
MSLGTWQTALTLMVAAHASGRRERSANEGLLASLNLPAEERAWLSQIVNAPGFQLTCSIQRWWRELRLKASVRLTLKAMPPQTRAELLCTWLDKRAETSFFYAREAVAFLDFVLDRLPDAPHLASICRFERAVHLASQASDEFSARAEPIASLPPDVRVRRHPTASLVIFAAPSESVFGALMAGASLPEVGPDEFPVIIAPGLPSLCRPATAMDIALWTESADAISLPRLCKNGKASPNAVLEMLQEGVLALDASLKHEVS